EVLQQAHGHAVRTFARERQDREGFAKALEGRADQEQRFALDIDHPAPVPDEAVGGAAGVDQQRYRDAAAPGTPRLVQAFAQEAAAAQVGAALDAGVDVDVP